MPDGELRLARGGNGIHWFWTKAKGNLIQMSHLLHRPILANASLRSVRRRHLATLQGCFGLGIDEVSQHDRLRRFLKRQWTLRYC